MAQKLLWALLHELRVSSRALGEMGLLAFFAVAFGAPVLSFLPPVPGCSGLVSSTAENARLRAVNCCCCCCAAGSAAGNAGLEGAAAAGGVERGCAAGSAVGRGSAAGFAGQAIGFAAALLATLSCVNPRRFTS